MEPVKHLTLMQVRQLRKLTDESADHLAIAWSCGVSVDEARAWFNTAPAGDVARCLATIFRISGLTEEAQFPDPAADDVQPAREGNGDGCVPVLPGDTVGQDGG